jgi:hypothetical protein
MEGRKREIVCDLAWEELRDVGYRLEMVENILRVSEECRWECTWPVAKYIFLS